LEEKYCSICLSILVEKIRFNPEVINFAGIPPSIWWFSSNLVKSLLSVEFAQTIVPSFVFVPFVMVVLFPIQLKSPISILPFLRATLLFFSLYTK
jgi:hypothetical protein